MTTNPDNKFIAYFQTNPFDVLNDVKESYGLDLTAPSIQGGYSAAAYSVLTTTTYENAFEASIDQEAQELLDNEQATIIY